MTEITQFSFVLRPSKLGGVGVFAMHDIAAGTQLFSGKLPMRKVRVTDVPEDFHKYCIFLSDSECMAPMRFDRLEVGWFVNHSYRPNIIKKIKNEKAEIIALRKIKADEEILIDYNLFNEPEHIKEPYYQRKSSK